MAYTLFLNEFGDLQIKNGKFLYVSGSDEVCQRVKVALNHELGEYFLNVNHGLPAYSQILGSKITDDAVVLIVRNEILKVPGVVRVDSIGSYRKDRNISVDASIFVSDSNGEKQFEYSFEV